MKERESVLERYIGKEREWERVGTGEREREGRTQRDGQIELLKSRQTFVPDIFDYDYKSFHRLYNIFFV